MEKSGYLSDYENINTVLSAIITTRLPLIPEEKYSIWSSTIITKYDILLKPNNYRKVIIIPISSKFYLSFWKYETFSIWRVCSPGGWGAEGMERSWPWSAAEEAAFYRFARQGEWEVPTRHPWCRPRHLFECYSSCSI